MDFLKPFEKYENNKEKILRVDENAEIYYIYKEEESYIAWLKREKENVGLNFIEYTNSYYDILNGDYILTGTVIKEKNKTRKRHGGAKVYKLYNLIKVKGLGIYDLTFDEILSIVGKSKKI